MPPKKSPGKSSKKRLPAAKVKELAKRYNTSEEQVEKFTDAFNEVDQDDKGILDNSVLIAALSRAGFKVAPKQADLILKFYKKTKKMGLDVDRFLLTVLRKLKWSKPEAQAEAQKLFQTFDTNKDGVLSPEELRKGMESLGDPMTEDEATELMQLADKNKDGKVSYEEFLEIWKAYYGTSGSPGSPGSSGSSGSPSTPGPPSAPSV